MFVTIIYFQFHAEIVLLSCLWLHLAKSSSKSPEIMERLPKTKAQRNRQPCPCLETLEMFIKFILLDLTYPNRNIQEAHLAIIRQSSQGECGLTV